MKWGCLLFILFMVKLGDILSSPSVPFFLKIPLLVVFLPLLLIMGLFSLFLVITGRD